MLDKLDALKDYMYYFQFTLNSYGVDVERNIPSKSKVIVPDPQAITMGNFGNAFCKLFLLFHRKSGWG